MKPSVISSADLLLHAAAADCPIVVGPVGEALARLPGHRMLVTDRHVARAHPELFAGTEPLFVESGERHKSPAAVVTLARELLRRGADRTTWLVGVGGGIVTDLAGFASSIYLRGIPFVAVPTTLLAQVDAAIGGKNGVNLDGYKNVLGTFTQPRLVAIDPSLLRTLPLRTFRAGLAEAIKVALVGDAALFALLEGGTAAALRQDEARLAEVILRSVRLKVAVVEQDEREAGERRKLNFGHTVAHAIEKCTARMVHGEAVAVGCACMTHVGERMGLLAPTDGARIRAALAGLGFRLALPVGMERLVEAMRADKKVESGDLHLVVPDGIGSCRVVRLPFAEAARLLVEAAAEE